MSESNVNKNMNKLSSFFIFVVLIIIVAFGIYIDNMGMSPVEMRNPIIILK